MPLISIVCAAYNCEKSIADTIRGIINQTFTDWEMIVVDDSSVDKTWNIITEMSKLDCRVKPFLNKQNQGFSFTRDRAVKEATGKIIVINDADDISYPDRLDVIAKNFRSNPDTNIFYSNVDYYYLETNKKEKRFFQPFDKELLKQINFIPDPGSSFCKKDYLKLGGYDTKIKLGADYDLWLRAVEAGMKFSYAEETLSQYTKHANSLTAKSSPEAVENRQNWNRYIREKNSLAQINPKVVKKLARPEVCDFYLRDNFEIWFGYNSLSKNQKADFSSI